MRPELFPVPRPHPNETFLSAVCRASLIHGHPSVKEFALSHRLSFRGLLEGNVEMLKSYANLTLLDLSALENCAISHLPDHLASIRGNVVTQHFLTRQAGSYCPKCIAQDLNRSVVSGWNAYVRPEWEVSEYRVCVHHNVALERLKPLGDRNREYFSVATMDTTALQPLTENLRPETANAIDWYIYRRLNQLELDQFPEYRLFDGVRLDHVFQFCRALGFVDPVVAKMKTSNNYEDVRRLATSVGFEALSKGVSGVQKFLNDAVIAYQRQSKPSKNDAVLRCFSNQSTTIF